MLNLLKQSLSLFGFLEPLRQTYFYHLAAVSLTRNLKSLFLKERVFYSAILKKGNLCFDVGANNGGRTFLFHRLGTRVIAVEPDPRAFKFLKLRYGKKKNITLLNYGLGECEEVKELIEFSSSTLSTFDVTDALSQVADSRLSGNQIQAKIRTQIRTLDSLISEFGMPQYIKISVVGFEVYVLKGLSLAVPSISFTLNSPYHIEKSLLCMDLLSGLAQYKFNYCSTPATGFILKDWVEPGEMIHIIHSIANEPGTRYFEIYARIINKNNKIHE